MFTEGDGCCCCCCIGCGDQLVVPAGLGAFPLLFSSGEEPLLEDKDEGEEEVAVVIYCCDSLGDDSYSIGIRLGTGRTGRPLTAAAAAAAAASLSKLTCRPEESVTDKGESLESRRDSSCCMVYDKVVCVICVNKKRE